MDNGNDFFVFSKFYSDEEQDKMEKYCSAAFDKLQTLYPGKKIMQQGHTTLCIESDSLYAENGIDTYEIGLTRLRSHHLQGMSGEKTSPETKLADKKVQV